MIRLAETVLNSLCKYNSSILRLMEQPEIHSWLFCWWKRDFFFRYVNNSTVANLCLLLVYKHFCFVCSDIENLICTYARRQKPLATSEAGISVASAQEKTKLNYSWRWNSSVNLTSNIVSRCVPCFLHKLHRRHANKTKKCGIVKNIDPVSVCHTICYNTSTAQDMGKQHLCFCTFPSFKTCVNDDWIALSCVGSMVDCAGAIV